MRRLPLRIPLEDRPYRPNRFRATPYRRGSHSPLVVLLATLLLLMLSAVIGWRAAHADTLDEIGGGELLLRATDDSAFHPAVLLDSKVHFEVTGLVNRVTLTQSFRNDGNDWQEALYAFPLPEQAAVRSLRIRIGERLIEGEICERAVAKQIYQQARSEGRKAGLVQQQRPNLFTTAVANIGPGEQVDVELEYIDAVRYEAGQFSLRFPMTITARYIPGKPLLAAEADQSIELFSHNGWATPTDRVPDADHITPFQHAQPAGNETTLNPIAITAELDASLPLVRIDSPYHRIASKSRGNQIHVELVDGSVAMDRDFVLQWQVRSGSEPLAALALEQVDDQHYAQLMLMPPQPVAATTGTARELLFIIDTSGSMGGTSIEQARAALLTALQRLQSHDRFNVIEFNDTAHALFEQSEIADAAHIAHASRFVAALDANGGTEMLSALQLALSQPAHPGHLRQVVFITDGAIGNESELFDAIRAQLGNARLFTVGIGSAPNSYFMRKAAEFGRGSATHIGNVNEVQQRIATLLGKLEAPLVTDLKVEWPDASTEMFPQQMPDLYRGEPLQISAKLPALHGRVLVRGTVGGQPWQRSIGLDQVAPDNSGVASLWARRKIEQLLDEKRHTDSEDAKSDIRDAVLAVALPHHLLSPYTSFVAVEHEISRPADTELTRSNVANARPAGQSPQTFAQTPGNTSVGYPATATDGPETLVLALLLLLMGWMLRYSQPKALLSKENEHGFAQRH